MTTRSHPSAACTLILTLLAAIVFSGCPACAQETTTGQSEITVSKESLLRKFRREFIEITPGKVPFPRSFQMGGDEPTARPIHEVTFTYSFAVSKYEVTQELWQAVMGNNPSRWKGPRNSVEMLTFHEAVKFCAETTKLLREMKLIDKDQVIRLPSEAEWEYFARAGTKSAYSFADSRAIDEFAWYTGNAAGNDPPVGAKKPNPWGLFDVHGYLWEWCADDWHDSYQAAPRDGSPYRTDDKSPFRVLRGGSWKDPATRLTVSYRRREAAETKDDAIGLRCILARQKP